MKRLGSVVALAGGLVCALAWPAAADSRPPPSPWSRPSGGQNRVVVVSLPGTSLQDWIRSDAFALRRLLAFDGVGLISTRTALRPATTQRACLSRASSSRRTMRQGVRSEAASIDRPAPSALNRLLDERGVPEESFSPTRIDTSFPTGRRIDYDRLLESVRASTARLIVVDVTDTLAADCAGGAQRDRWIGIALGRADAFLGAARAALAPGDRLLVLSSAAPWTRERGQNWLGAAAVAAGADEHAGVLTSATTRRRGVVALLDVATTLVRFLGVDARIGVGRPIRVVDGSLADVADADEAYTHASRLRLPLLRGYVWIAVALIALAGLIILAGRGRARGGRTPRTARDLIAVGLLALLAAPGAMVFEPALHLRSAGLSIAFVAAAAVFVALVSWIFNGARWAAGLCALVSAAGLIAFLGPGEMGARSALSFSVAAGDRFYGIGNETMGAVLAASLVFFSVVLDARPWRRRIVATTAAAIAVAMAVPVAGAKFGSIFVTVPAFGVFLALAFGRRPGRLDLLGIAIAAVLLAGVVAAWNMLLSPEAQTHVAAAASDPQTLSRKVGAALRLAAGSYWTAAIVVPAAIAAVLAWRRPALLARGTWGRPHLRFAGLACVAAAITAVLFNDAGVAAAGLISVPAVSSLLSVLLVGQARAPEASERMKRWKEFAR